MRTGTVVLLIVLAVISFLGLALAGVVCLALFLGRSRNGVSAAKANPVVVNATDGRSRVCLPDGWSVRPDMNNALAGIKVGDPVREAYLLVISEPKADFADNMTYRGHSDLTRGLLMKNIQQPTIVAGPTELTINGRHAVQYEIHGISKTTRLKLAYLHTTVDGEKMFHQVLAWTMQSRAAETRPALNEAIDSFTDLP